MKVRPDKFPHGIAGAIANPVSFGKITNQIFSYPLSTLRVLAGYNIINLTVSDTAPTNPSMYDVWATPSNIVNNVVVESDVKIYTGTWSDPTQLIWKKTIGEGVEYKGEFVQSSSYRKNDIVTITNGNGSIDSYICITNTSNEPFSTNQWKVISKGAKGVTGAGISNLSYANGLLTFTVS